MVRIRPGTLEDAALLWQAEVEIARTAGRLVSRPHELLLEAFQIKLRELGPRGCYVVAVEEEDIAGHFLEPMSLEALQHVYRLTIVVHPGRTGRLYQRLGFVEEGRFRDRIRLPDGTFVDDIAMA
jgi:hypothetical protein